MNNILGINQQERINSLIQHENYRYWLGGFVEGEGALVVSIVKNDRLSNGISLQPSGERKGNKKKLTLPIKCEHSKGGLNEVTGSLASCRYSNRNLIPEIKNTVYGKKQTKLQ